MLLIMWRALSRTTTVARFLPTLVTRRVASMPPKRTASKRKAESTSDDEAEPSRPSRASKKTKVTVSTPTADESGLASNGQPTNKVLPVNIAFPPKIEGTVRISAWNVCGLAAASKKVRPSHRVMERYLTKRLAGLQILHRGGRPGYHSPYGDQGV